jgi:hypothetical protein
MANNADPNPENPWINPAIRKMSDMASNVIMVIFHWYAYKDRG